MKTIYLLLFLMISYSGYSTTYYFSANSGDDSRSPDEAQNPSTPWKSLGKLNSFFSSLQPGDQVFLKRGETFYGSIIVNKSGTSGSPIFIGAYGSGDKPVITSLVTLSNWVSKGNGIWESFNSSLPSKLNMVLFDGIQQEMGRYPNNDAENKGYLNFTSHNGTASLSDDKLNSTPDFTGAELVLRVRRWVIDRNLITDHSGSTITYVKSSNYEPRDGYGYFIQNSIKTLDKPGEWYYNPLNKKLSVYFGSKNPSFYTIQAATYESLISAQKFSNVIFDNLNIEGANASGVSIKYGSNINIENCDIAYSGNNGVQAFTHDYFKIENSTISYSNYGGINLGFSGDYAVIRNNKINNTNTFSGLGESGDSKGVGIFTSGNNSIIEYNELINTGWVGIFFNGNYVTIKNNLIDNFCITKDDGAGIYTYVGSVDVNLKGRKLIGNIILNGQGVPEGVRGAATYPAEGIYLDNGASGVDLTGNTIANCGNQGVYIHCAHEITMNNNTLFNNITRQLSVIGLANHPKIRNCIITNNIFFVRRDYQRLLYIKSDEDDTKEFGKFENNYYARPLDDQSDSSLAKIRLSEPDAKLFNFTQDIRFEYNATKEAKKVVLDANYIDIKGNKYSGSLTLQPFTSRVLIQSGVTQTNNPPVVDIISPENEKQFSGPATIKISADASDSDGAVSKVEFYNGNKLLDTENFAPYTYMWNNVPNGNYSITAKATDNDGNVTTSDVVDVTVESADRVPSVSLTSPGSNTNYSAPGTIKINAVASDDNGTITKVEFYSGSTMLHAETEAPYTHTWYNVPKGTYSITAKATDNDGNVTTSDAAVVTVGPANGNSPVVSIINPQVNDSYTSPATINLLASAFDTDGNISKVEFFSGSTLLHTEYEMPYTYTWNDVPQGNYQIMAVATDNDGNVTTSDMVPVSVGGSNKLASKPGSANSAVATGPADILNNKSLSLKLSPNPARDILNVVTSGFRPDEKVTIFIVSSVGTVMKTIQPGVTLRTIFPVDVSNLSNGIYFVKVVSGNKVLNQKFVKL